MKNTKIILSLVLILTITLSFVSAYQRLCLTYGQSIPDEENPLKTCYHDICQICVTDNYYPTAPYKCRDIEGCKILGNNSSIDQEPPNVTINSPIQDEIYNSRKVLFDLESEEPFSLTYIDNINGRGRWKRLSSLTESFSRYISFRDGLNDITIKMRDRNSNSVEKKVQFYVDSKEPRISKAETDYQGKYIVEFKEENPAALLLHFGNSLTGYQVLPFNLSNCVEERGRQICEEQITFDEYLKVITPYSNQNIEFWFELIDMAGSKDETKKEEFFVDISLPEIIYLNYSFDDRYVYLDIEINESRLDEITYIDTLDSRARERSICRRMEGNKCTERLSFRDGEHNLTIFVKDESGNKVSETINFFVDSKEPRISKTEPKRGFASGIFEVEFREENPVELILYYKNQSKTEQKTLNLSECLEGRRGFSCNTNVDLTGYTEIKYWFELTDLVGNKAESKPVILDVDTTPPELLNPDTFWEKEDRNVYVSLEIKEENFESAYYIDRNDRRPRWRRLCNRLDENKCEKRLRFRNGNHSIDIQINDEAGNSIGTNFEVDI